MLNTHINECTDCVSIDRIIAQIDELLCHYAKNAVHNSKYELDKYIPTEKMEKLIHYKSILLKRRLNSEYLWKISNSVIISRVTTLLN